MAELVRVGLVLDASGIQQGLGQVEAGWRRLAVGAEQAMAKIRRDQSALALGAKDSGVAIDALRDRYSFLSQQYRLGLLPMNQYDAQLRILRADIAQLAATTRLGAEATQLLAQTGRAAAGDMAQLGKVQMMQNSMVRASYGGFTRAAFGVQMLSQSMDRGRLNAQGLSSALLALSIGNPQLMALVAGISAIVAAMAILRNRTRESREQAERLVDAYRAAIREGDELLNRRIAELQRKAQPGAVLPGLPAPVGRLRREEQIELHQLVLERQRRREAARERPPSAVPEAEAFWATMRQLGHPLGTGPLAGAGPARQQFPLPDLELMTDQAMAAANAMNPLIAKMFEVGEAAQFFGDAATAGFGALIDQMSMGEFGLSGLAKAVLREVSTMARAKALFEFAEGIAALFNPFAGPGLAAGHFRAAAAYGAAAVGAGLIGGGGGGVGGQGGNYSGGYSAGRPGSSGRPVIIVQIVGQTSREVIQEIIYDTQRDANRGGRALGISPSYAVIPVQGAIVRRV